MSTMSPTKLPVWFWVIAAIALLWNLIGVYAYWADVTMSEEAIAKMSAVEQELYNARPSWLTGAYAIAVFAGVLGSVALVLRRNYAMPLFGLSLAAIIIQMGYVLFGMNAIALLGASTAIFPAVITIIGVFLLWFSMQSKSKGWLQ
ncbi:hypothetical protein [Hyphococcus sp.]|uniref:hypothetical protein n=1 Tax=Hyphococcus sp. TaxID=2038636 RepID=UPI00208A91E6|nr:MAG: hypothetical protein DHS20C04_20510 [Marinicaulis sp.]